MAADRVTLTEVIDGPVTARERVYAFEQMRDLCRTAPRAIRRARTRLTAPAAPKDDWPAAAEGTLMLDGGLILGAGVTAATMYQAIDLLMARFRYRLHRLEETRPDQPIGSFPTNADRRIHMADVTVRQPNDRDRRGGALRRRHELNERPPALQQEPGRE